MNLDYMSEDYIKDYIQKKEKAEKVLFLLDEHYPFEDKCFLNYEYPHELLIATILSAQCTDDRVNIVTKDLFRKYTTVADFANANQTELEKDIYSTGFYRNKAKNIILSMQKIISEYNGVIPSDIDKLVKLAGVGRKTANIFRGHIYGIPSIAVDTHVKRISKKLGLTKNIDPVKIEYDLMDILPETHWIRYNTQVISHGRAICKAKKPDCNNCFMLELCISSQLA